MALMLRNSLLIVIGLVLFANHPSDTFAQKPDKIEIQTWREVLKNVKTALNEDYYDKSFHGMDLDARFKAADEKMTSAASLGQLVGIVAQVLLELNDSHTFFIPPYNSSSVEYGWRMQPVGVDCYIGAVKPGSDAEAKGLRVGDKVISIDGRPLDRTKVWLANYLYYTLRPQPGMTLLVEKPDKRQQEVVIKAKVREGTTFMTYRDWLEGRNEALEEGRLYRHRFHELNDEVLIWKMPQFDLSEEALDDKIGKLKNRKALILDLRGNPGGYTKTLEHLAGYFFDSNIKIADRRGRRELEPIMVRSKNAKVFKGQLIALIDGTSSSAAELFARLIQLEKRGIVIGDRSSGSVMESRYRSLQVGVKEGLSFGISATDADLLMADGKSLEHVGVTPDVLVLPSAEDMSNHHDPVLVQAASLIGVKLDPKTAGELFPTEWKSK